MKIQLYTILVYSKDALGVLSGVAHVFSSHKISINSLSTSTMGQGGKVCITITVFANRSYVELMAVELGLLEYVYKVCILSNNAMFYQKLALFKMDTSVMLSNPSLQDALFNREFKVVEINPKYIIFSIMGDDATLENLYHGLKPLGVLQWAQSGLVPIAMEDDTTLKV